MHVKSTTSVMVNCNVVADRGVLRSHRAICREVVGSVLCICQLSLDHLCSPLLGTAVNIILLNSIKCIASFEIDLTFILSAFFSYVQLA